MGPREGADGLCIIRFASSNDEKGGTGKRGLTRRVTLVACPAGSEGTSVRTLPHHMYSEPDLAPTGRDPPLPLGDSGGTAAAPSASVLL